MSNDKCLAPECPRNPALLYCVIADPDFGGLYERAGFNGDVYVLPNYLLAELIIFVGDLIIFVGDF